MKYFRLRDFSFVFLAVFRFQKKMFLLLLNNIKVFNTKLELFNLKLSRLCTIIIKLNVFITY